MVKKAIIFIGFLLCFTNVSLAGKITRGSGGSGFSCTGYSVYYQAISSSTLDCFDVNDGSTVTLNNATSDASGLLIDSTTDTPSIVASDGNNIDYGMGEIGFTYQYTSGTLETSPFAIVSGDGYLAFSLYRLNTNPDWRFIINSTVVLFSSVTNIFDGASHTVVLKWNTATNVEELYIDGSLQDGQKTVSITEPTITDTNLYFMNREEGSRSMYGYMKNFYIKSGNPF